MFVIQKILSILIFLICILNLKLVSAGEEYVGYSDYLGGDRNYLMTYGHQDSAMYMDKRTLSIEKYDPPIYVISFDEVMVHQAAFGNTDIAWREKYFYLYNWDERKMYCLYKDSWHYISPTGNRIETSGLVAGEMAFYIAYKMKFYGSKFETAFTDGIYLIVDGAI